MKKQLIDSGRRTAAAGVEVRNCTLRCRATAIECEMVKSGFVFCFCFFFLQTALAGVYSLCEFVRITPKVFQRQRGASQGLRLLEGSSSLEGSTAAARQATLAKSCDLEIYIYTYTYIKSKILCVYVTLPSAKGGWD